MTGGGRAAVFLDRDGVIIPESPGYVLSPAHVELLPGAADAIGRLTRAGMPVVVVTNQSPIGRGLLTEGALDAIHARLQELIGLSGGSVSEFCFCPHLPDAGCDCRKPRPGLLREASRRLGIDLGASYLVGDQEADIQAALAAGCAAILVLSEQTVPRPPELADSCTVVADLAAAVDVILGDRVAAGQ